MELFDDFSEGLSGKQESSEAEQEKKDLEMVKWNGLDLEYVKEQTSEICLAAV